MENPKMLDNLIWILGRSVERNGEIPLTNRHLLNIIQMLKRKEQSNQGYEKDDLIEGLAEIEACGNRG